MPAKWGLLISPENTDQTKYEGRPSPMNAILTYILIYALIGCLLYRWVQISKPSSNGAFVKAVHRQRHTSGRFHSTSWRGPYAYTGSGGRNEGSHPTPDYCL
jgi:hypothetical protein